MGNPQWENPSFFKVMIGDDFRTTLRIPQHFRKHLGEYISKKWVLRSPGGWQRHIKMGIVGDQLFFQDGWGSFLSDNSISVGDFLVFFYDGDIGFDVKIFGNTGCEKVELSTTPIKGVKIEAEDPLEEKPIQCFTLDQRKVSPKVSKKRRSAVTAKKSIVKKSKLCYKVLTAAKPIESEKVLKAACSFKTNHPHFVTTCRKSRAGYMTIPSNLAKKYNLAQKNLIVLRDPHGTAWPIKLSSWRDGRQCLQSGWSHLYKKNGLKEGDVCLLEFVQGGNAINVHIFRAEDCNAKSIPESGKKLPVEDKERILKESNSLKSSTRKRLQTKGDIERALQTAKSFKSRHPKFFILWKMTRLYHVPIPKNVVKKLALRTNQRTVLSDPLGRTWPVDIMFRSYGSVDLGIGWCNFSKGNNLAPGDACVFEFLGGADAIKVHIFRVGEANSAAIA